MRKSTNKLTKHELNFAASKEYPLTKFRIMQAMNTLFDKLGQKLGQELNDFALLNSAETKITKGENYQNMPYMVLDFPKITGHKFPVVCRTLFWWGHYFTVNIIISTEWVNAEILSKNAPKLNKTYILIGDDLWDNHLKSGNYIRIQKLAAADLTQLIQNSNYLRLSQKIKLSKIEGIEKIVPKVYTQWLENLGIKKGA